MGDFSSSSSYTIHYIPISSTVWNLIWAKYCPSLYSKKFVTIFDPLFGSKLLNKSDVYGVNFSSILALFLFFVYGVCAHHVVLLTSNGTCLDECGYTIYVLYVYYNTTRQQTISTAEMTRYTVLMTMRVQVSLNDSTKS